MANICDQRVVIAAQDDADMSEALKLMLGNVLEGPNGTEYFSREEVDAAGDDMDALYELVKRTDDHMNLFCLFTAAPDTRTESGWLAWSIDHVNGHPVFETDIGAKWGPSSDPRRFCEELDKRRFAYSISAGGEAFEWETLDIDSDYFEASEVAGVVENAQKKLASARSLKKIAYYKNLSGVMPDLYSYDEDW